MKLLSFFIVLLLIAIGVTFSCLNAQPVVINYYLGEHTFPLSLLLVLALAAGVLVGLLIGMFMYVGAKSQSLRLNRRVRLAEKEVANLRAVPLQGKH